MHSAADYRERGASATLSFGEAEERPGLSFSLSPSWGAPTDGTGVLWRDHGYRRGAANVAGHERALDARVGYSVELPGRRLLTSFGNYGRSRVGRRLRVGTRLAGFLEAVAGQPFRVEVSVERHERRGDEVDHRLSLVGLIQFGARP